MGRHLTRIAATLITVALFAATPVTASASETEGGVGTVAYNPFIMNPYLSRPHNNGSGESRDHSSNETGGKGQSGEKNRSASSDEGFTLAVAFLPLLVFVMFFFG